MGFSFLCFFFFFFSLFSIEHEAGGISSFISANCYLLFVFIFRSPLSIRNINCYFPSLQWFVSFNDRIVIYVTSLHDDLICCDRVVTQTVLLLLCQGNTGIIAENKDANNNILLRKYFLKEMSSIIISFSNIFPLKFYERYWARGKTKKEIVLFHVCEDKFQLQNPRRNPYILAAPHLALIVQNLPWTELCWLFHSIHLNKVTCLGANFRAYTRCMSTISNLKSIPRPLNINSKIIPYKVIWYCENWLYKYQFLVWKFSRRSVAIWEHLLRETT